MEHPSLIDLPDPVKQVTSSETSEEGQKSVSPGKIWWENSIGVSFLEDSGGQLLIDLSLTAGADYGRILQACFLKILNGWIFRRTSKSLHVLPILRGCEMGHQFQSVKEIFRDGHGPIQDNRVNCGYAPRPIRCLLMAVLICMKFCNIGLAAVWKPNMGRLI